MPLSVMGDELISQRKVNTLPPTHLFKISMVVIKFYTPFCVAGAAAFLIFTFNKTAIT